MKKGEHCSCGFLMGWPDWRLRKVSVHLYGCPTSPEVEAYDSLPWYKRLFLTNPRKYYYQHYKDINP